MVFLTVERRENGREWGMEKRMLMFSADSFVEGLIWVFGDLDDRCRQVERFGGKREEKDRDQLPQVRVSFSTLNGNECPAERR